MTNDCLTTAGYFKDVEMALPSAEDAGFCSSEDYLETELHSPTDTSEDSVEVKVRPIPLVSKRKLPETRKESFTGPLKKRMCLKVKAEINDSHPFRPWSPSSSKNKIPSEEIVKKPKEEVKFASYFRPPSPIGFYPQTEPVALVKKREITETVKVESDGDDRSLQGDSRVPVHPRILSLSAAETERMILKTNELFPSLQSCDPTSDLKKSAECQRREQRNYKNMTRERRIEANARERTRVHTISAAFDTLRRSVPSYSHNQKLSKLSVLRIACSYIMTLSSIANEDDEAGTNAPSTSECVEMVSRTIQREGKLRKKKDDND